MRQIGYSESLLIGLKIQKDNTHFVTLTVFSVDTNPGGAFPIGRAA